MSNITQRGLIIAAAAILLTGCRQEAAAGEAGWMTDYDAALQKAVAENKHVLVDFSGSDWCGWCIKLDKEVFSKETFVDYADENLVLLLVDFPRSKEQSDEQRTANEALAEKYGIRGFPTVLILNPQGEVIERTGYQQGGADAYIEMIKGVIAE
jgi:protein disulfide-isomerase